jgi:hypothetical protein
VILKVPDLKKTKNNTGYICHEKWGNGSCLGSMFDVTLPVGIAVHPDHYGGHYREKNSCPHNDAIKIQPPKSRGCSLTLVGPRIKGWGERIM